jgi:Isochorismatase family
VGPTFPELVEALPGVEIIDRSSVNAFDDARVARAIEATNRKKLIFAGISLEVCAAFPAITAVGKGLDAYVAVDASGTFSETERQAGLLRMLQAGVIISDYATLMVEILKDNARSEAGEVYGAMDMAWAKLVGQIAVLRKVDLRRSNSWAPTHLRESMEVDQETADAGGLFRQPDAGPGIRAE